jgi:hypothetical protein
VLETAAVETLALENTIARNRALGGFAATGLKLLEAADIEERLRALELALAAARTGGGSDPTGGLLDG